MDPETLDCKSYRSLINVREHGVIHAGTSLYDLRSYTEMLKRDQRIQSVLIPRECLKNRISAMAEEIARDFPPDRPLHCIVVLTGAFVLAADLGRELFDRAGINIRFHLIKTSVYGDTIKKSGELFRKVKLEIAPKDIEGKDILVIEDIVDQGLTLTWLKNYLLSERKVTSVKICCLLDKVLKCPSVEVRKMREQLLLDYVGFKIPDFWVAGYGVDIAQELRSLPCIVTVDESLFI